MTLPVQSDTFWNTQRGILFEFAYNLVPDLSFIFINNNEVRLLQLLLSSKIAELLLHMPQLPFTAHM